MTLRPFATSDQAARPSRPALRPLPARLAASAAVLAAGLLLVACAARPQRALPEPQAAPSTQVYFYPTRGQGAARQDRDRYECYLWAVKQTGFDPSLPQLAPHQRFDVVVATPPPGHETAAGAVTGALIGAVVSPAGRSAEGAVVGAAAGAVIGAASEGTRQQQAQRAQQRATDRRQTELEQQAAGYRRAMTACLEGRGYSVR